MVELLPFSVEDAPFILRLLNEPSFIENIGDRGVRSVEQAADYLLRGPLASYAAHGYGLLRVALTATGESIGMAGLISRPQLARPDLGYAFLPEHTGRGRGRLAARMVLESAAREHRLERVLAVVKPGNQRSLHLLHALGFRHCGEVTLYAAEPPDLLLEVELPLAPPLP